MLREQYLLAPALRDDEAHDAPERRRLEELAVDFALTPGQRELRARAAAFVDEVLIPLELTAELAGGRLPEADRRHVRDQARERGLDSGNHAVELGGRGWDNVEQVLVQEELGRNTNAIWWNMAGGYNVLSSGTPEQIERYLRPTLRGERADAYAVTEGGAGSDSGAIAGTAVETAGGWHLSTEKWFVTTGDVADYFIVMVNVLRDGELLPTLFLVDRDTPGIEVVDDPPFTHNYPHGHPTIRFDCDLPADAVLGGPDLVGKGDELQNEWFVEERIHIGARCVGAMRRLLAETVDWTIQRRAVRLPHLRLPGRQLPAGRLGVGLPGGAAAGLPRGLHGRRPRRRPQAGAPPGQRGQAVRQRGGLPLRRPGGAGVRRPRLHADEHGRAVPARAAGRPHLGGHQRDPAADRGPRARAPRRRDAARRDRLILRKGLLLLRPTSAIALDAFCGYGAAAVWT